MSHLPALRCAVGTEVVPDDALVKTAYYNEIGLKYETTQVIFAVLRNEGGISSFSVMRGHAHGDFDAKDKALMEALSPHLRRPPRRTWRRRSPTGSPSRSR